MTHDHAPPRRSSTTSIGSTDRAPGGYAALDVAEAVGKLRVAAFWAATGTPCSAREGA
jgi:hypothetical protein